ncbi:MAG: carboxypeptidase regulatory-like domain-containing protein, partial [Acidobacteriota bacterium]|nr:carboxypeptidase regulatory-like domain-containing protein [Acidobacteriota bacterium]
MRSRWLVAVAAVTLLAVPTLRAQDSRGPHARTAARFGASPPLREMAGMEVEAPAFPPGGEVPIRVPESLRRIPNVNRGPDALSQMVPGLSEPTSILSFEGYSSDDNQALFGFRMMPPDTDGDVGPNHYVQWNNLGFKVWDKAGNLNPLTAPNGLPGNIFWAGFGGVCESDNNGDPVVLYDHLADRWFMTQFTDSSNPDGHACVAVSQTPDPLGAYWLYDFVVSPGAFNDYPKWGVWPDGYYGSHNEFTTAFVGSRVVVLERAAMLAGNPARFVDFFLPGGAVGIFNPEPAHLEGPPPPPGTPNTYVMACDDATWDCNGADGGPDGYHNWDFSVDWVTPANSSFTYNGLIAAAPFDSNLCGFADCVPQPGTAQRLDVLGQMTMYRAQYRNFGGYETIVTSHSVDVDGADTAGVRWAELRNTAGAGWVLQQEGTYDLGDGVHRWMPSAAMDGFGNICVVYSASDGATVYPSVRFACHEVGVDPPGTMGAETVCVAGAGVQTGGGRWGDYATLSIDPVDDCSFWGTNEYVATGGSFVWNTRVCSWVFPACIGPTGLLDGTVRDANTSDPIAGALIDADGFTTSTDVTGSYSRSLPVGSYLVTAATYGYSTGSASGVAIVDGVVTTQDFDLFPATPHTLEGTVTDGGCAGWPLYARIDIDHVDPAGDQAVFTDPATGHYSATVFDGDYTLRVTALMGGYASDGRPVAIVGGDRVEDFGLLPDASCTAPGYGSPPALIDEDFEGTFAPAGWTVIDNATAAAPVWSNLVGCGETGNYTNGSGDLACSSSDKFGSADFDTELWTPTFDVGGLGAVGLSFTVNYQNYLGSDFFQVDLSTDGGGSWSTNLLSWNEDHGGLREMPGEDVAIDLLAAGATGSNNRLRFHYFDPNSLPFDWYIQVDDVWIGDSACRCEEGGIFYGNVYDANTTDPVNGATVEDDTQESATTAATPGDPALDDGFYALWVPDGATELAASAPTYGDEVQPITPAPGWTLQDFSLPAGLLSVAPGSLTFDTVISGSPVSQMMSIVNSGGLTANYNLLEFDTGALPPSSPVAPLEPEDPDWRLLRETDHEAWERASATRAVGLELNRPDFVLLPQPEGAGDLLATYPGPTLPWGIGVDKAGGNSVWLSDLGVAGGTDTNIEYEVAPSWAPTGNTVDWSGLGAVFMGDMAYNIRTGRFWQVDVAGSNCILEFDPDPGVLAFTGASICPAFGASMRGLAFDPVTNTYFAGTWESGGFIVRFDTDGDIVGGPWNNGWAVSGLAYNPSTGHLFAIANTDTPPDIVVFDATNPTLPVLYAFSSGMAAFDPAGLGFDCDGALWAPNQGTTDIWVIDSGEDGVCDVFDIPWFSVSGACDGTVAAMAQDDCDATVDPTGGSPGCYEAMLVVEDDTPYGQIEVPIDARVTFADSGTSASWQWADPFIHGLADGGVTDGCGAGSFCAEDATIRSEMAVWLLRSMEGGDYSPPDATGLIFTDVTLTTYAADFIEELANRGITEGSPECSGAPGPPYATYCPDDATSRAQMARMILLGTEAPGYDPPVCLMPDARTFTDVPWDDPFCKYVEEAERRGLVFGSRSCSAVPGPPFATYCPDDSVSRSAMSFHLVNAFDTLDVCVNPASPVPPTGACLLPNDTCLSLTPLECLFFGEGVYVGDGAACPTPTAGSMQFSLSAYTVAENGASATITVTRTGGDFGAASVNFTTSNGSATAGSDYTAATGTINFTDGDAVAKTFNVPITDDSTWEGDETVNLSLSTPVGATLGTPSSAVLTITEDDPTPPAGSMQFSLAAYSVAENGTSATITVTRTG